MEGALSALLRMGLPAKLRLLSAENESAEAHLRCSGFNRLAALFSIRMGVAPIPVAAL